MIPSASRSPTCGRRWSRAGTPTTRRPKKDTLAVSVPIKCQLHRRRSTRTSRASSRRRSIPPIAMPAGPDADADQCVRAAVEPALKALTTVRDAFATKLTITVEVIVRSSRCGGRPVDQDVRCDEHAAGDRADEHRALFATCRRGRRAVHARREVDARRPCRARRDRCARLARRSNARSVPCLAGSYTSCAVSLPFSTATRARAFTSTFSCDDVLELGEALLEVLARPVHFSFDDFAITHGIPF